MVVLVIGITAALGVVARGVGMFVLGQPAALWLHSRDICTTWTPLCREGNSIALRL
jgi:hypothetical protein